MTLDNDAYDPLDDPYPEEFADITVGTAINADTAQLLGEAFDTAALEREGLLIKGNYGEDSKRYVDATDTSSQNLWGWDAKASVKLDLGIVGASAKFFVQQSLSSCRRSSQMRAFAWNLHTREVKLKGKRENLRERREQLLACRTKPFAAKMDAVLDAAKKFDLNDESSVNTLRRALTAFYDTYGTGFIHTVHDMAIGIFEGTMHSDSATEESNFLIGGGASVSVPFFSAGGAAQHFNKLKTTTDAKHFFSRASGRPTDCAPAIWAQELADSFNKNGIEQCISEKAWEAAFSTPPVVEEPEHDPKDPPDPLPAAAAAMGVAGRTFEAAKAVTEDADTNAIARAIEFSMRGIHLERLDPVYKNKPGDPFTAELEELRRQAALSPEEINAQAATLLTPEELSRRVSGGNADAEPVESSRSRVPAGAKAVAAGSPDESPNYAPRGYEYQEWSFLFPELGRIQKLCSTTQVVFGQAMVWFSIRSVFAQYLDFCAQFREMVGPGIVSAAGQFRTALNKVGDVLANSLNDADTDDKLTVDLKFLQRLEARLKSELLEVPGSANSFRMYKHYEFWVRNYPWLKQIPFGVVAVAERTTTDSNTGAQVRTYFYQLNPYPICPLLRMRGDKQTVKRVDSRHFPSPGELVTSNAYRLYPIISTDSVGDPYFIWVGSPSCLEGTNEDAQLRFSGLLSFYPREQDHPAYRKSLPKREDVLGGKGPLRGDVLFKETTLPMLIHQSAANAGHLAWAEDGFLKFRDREELQRRWENRKAMYGMNLYPGFDTEDGFEADFLLRKAGELAEEASKYGPVIPDISGPYENGWPLLPPDGGATVKAAYSSAHDAMFFWGPGPEGRNLFETCDIRLVPIDFNAVTWGSDRKRAVRAGGGPMWMEPRTEALVDDLSALTREKPPTVD